MVVPIPGSASRIGGLGVVEVGEDAGTILEIVSLEAAQASSSAIGGSALVRDGHAGLISIKDPVLRASKANLIVPIPGSASRIGGLGVVRGREDTGSLLEVVSLEAGSAGTALVVGSAVVRNRSANLISIEDPILRAGKANLVVPIPGGTAGISRLSIVGGRENAGTILEVVSLEASEAGSAVVMGSAVIGNRGANLIGIEDPVLRASKANLVIPVPGGAS